MSDPLEKMEFTTNWVDHHASKWLNLFGEIAGKPNLKGLEIGVYEGRSSKWWLQNILTDPSSKLIGVDPAPNRFESNLRIIDKDPRFEFRAEKGEGAMLELLKEGGPEQFDFIYLDGGKEAFITLSNTFYAWQLIKPGGIILWDDYGWKWKEGSIANRPKYPPSVAIDIFINLHQNHCKVVLEGWQWAIQKLVS